MRTFNIQENIIKKPIISYLSTLFPNVSYSLLQKALRNKDIRVNGKKITKNIPISFGDQIQLYITDEILFHFPKQLEIIYQDENILAINKPQGILSNNEVSNSSVYSSIGGPEMTLEDFVKKDFPMARICHRLDRNTSGIILFAKQDNAYQELLTAFEQGMITKEYVAYTSGIFDIHKNILENYITKDENLGFCKVYTKKVPNSQKIVTEYEVLEENIILNYSFLKIRIHTGKTHQIRAQMQALHHPIIGDSKYGKNEINQQFKKFKQMLYAVKYSFQFPHHFLLSYLNTITIALPPSYYENQIGSENIEPK